MLCPGNKSHGELVKRPIEKTTDEQKWCGEWYDCKEPGCWCSVLIPSINLRYGSGSKYPEKVIE